MYNIPSMTVWFDNIKENSNTLDFDVMGVDTSVANAIRRSILTNIPNVGFCHEPENKCTINIKKNTTALHDEFISHRISLLPLRREAFHKNIPIENYTFRLNITQKNFSIVTTDDFKVTVENAEGDETPLDPKLFFGHDSYSGNASIITRLPRKDASKEIETLEVECKAVRGSHEDGAGFSPVSVCSMYENENKKNAHHIMFESIGTIDPKVIVLNSFDYLIEKCEKTLEKLSKDDFIINEADANFKGVDMIFEGETHTFGNMLYIWIYNEYIVKRKVVNKSGTKLLHVSYHEPHPLKKSITFRIGLDDNSEDCNDHILITKNLFIENIKKLQLFLDDMRTKWKSI